MEWRLRGANEVVLLDPEGAFHPLATRDATEARLCGSIQGASADALAEPSRLGNAFGRFVLLVHDPKRRRLTVHTDRYGSVPLFRSVSGGRLHLARRLGALAGVDGERPRLDVPALSNLLAFGRTLGPRTPLAGVQTVESGRTVIDLDSLAMRRERLWEPEALLRGERVAFADAEEGLAKGFLEGVGACVAGSEEVVVTLSGGMDTRCLVAALLAGGRRPAAHHVSVPGSRAEAYAAAIAELCRLTFRHHPIDAGFAPRYFELLSRVVDASDGMRLAPQVEMLWLRDQIPETAVVLHGAFGELAKLRELRDYRLDEAALAAGRGELPELLWQRYRRLYRTRLRVLAPELRAEVEPCARANLEERLAAIPPDLEPPEALQLLYLDEFFRSTRFGHQLWNDRVATHFPFAHPAFLDPLLRVRTRDRLEQRFQTRFLERVDPRLARVPDENTGARGDAPAWLRALARASHRVANLVRGEGAESSHGDLLGWLDAMQPPLEEVVESCGDDGVFDRDELRSMVRALRERRSRSLPTRGVALRAVREQALALETFLILKLARERLRWSP